MPLTANQRYLRRKAKIKPVKCPVCGENHRDGCSSRCVRCRCIYVALFSGRGGIGKSAREKLKLAREQIKIDKRQDRETLSEIFDVDKFVSINWCGFVNR